MSKLILLGLCAFLVLINIMFAEGEAMIGPGKWKIFHINYKPGNVNDIIIDLKQSMINRTHYVYSGEIIAHEPLDGSLGLKMDICKHVDGGCKQFQVITDDSFMAFANKFAEENIKTCFEQMGVEPSELPLGVGEYKVKNFFFNAGQLPEECTYGHFMAEVCAMRGTIPVGCIECECEFSENNEDDDDDDDDDCDE